jgi:hypothetical protein
LNYVSFDSILNSQHPDALREISTREADGAGIEPEQPVFPKNERLMSMPEKNGVNTGELMPKPVPDFTGRSPPMNDAQAKGARLDYLSGREPLLNRIVIHIPGDSFKRVLLQVVQHLGFFHVPEMDQHIGVIAKFGAQGFELVCRLAEVSVGHYDYFHPAWDTFSDESRNARSMRPTPHT